MYDQSHDVNRSQDVRLELGGMTGVMTSTKVGMYDRSHDVELESGCAAGVGKCNRSRDV
jgi:hypothetical protein